MQTYYFSSEGLTIPYYIQGKGPPLLFFHGMGTNPFTYHTIIDRLSRNYTVISPLIPPFGRSQLPPFVWNFSDYAKFFRTFLLHLEHPHIIVIGHSFGGGIGLSLSSISPEVTHLILINPIGAQIPYKKRHLLWYAARRSFWWFLLGKQTLQWSILLDIIKSAVFHLLSIPHLIRIIFRTMYHSDIDMHAIQTKTAILWGDNDELFPQHYLSSITSSLRHVHVVHIDGYHNWCFFHPEIIERELKRNF